jgi:tetratricopeptide (TPR) repeat protein
MQVSGVSFGLLLFFLLSLCREGKAQSDLLLRMQSHRQEERILQSLTVCDSLLTVAPEQLAALDRQAWKLDAIRRLQPALEAFHLRVLVRLYDQLDKLYPEAGRPWLKAKTLTALIYEDSLPEVLQPCLRQCLLEAPGEMPSLFFETYSERLLSAIERDTLGLRLDKHIEEFIFWENIALNSPLLYPTLPAQVEAYQIRISAALQRQVPSCQQLLQTYEDALRLDILQPENYRFIYTALRLHGCAVNSFRDSVYTRYPLLVDQAYAYRIAAREAEARGDYLNALRWMEVCVERETDPRFLAQDYLFLARIYQARQNFRTARLYVERSDEVYPNWGYPFLFLAEMVVKSGPFCNFTPLEQKAIYWVGIDYCERAMNRNYDLYDQAIQLIQRYQSQMPNREEVLFYGLQVGDSFPVRCWLETATRVRYN